MKIILILAACLFSLLTLSAHAEVGQTNVIDAIATKPDQQEALLLLHQSRPWNEESIELLNKKIAFYALAISSESLVKQKPELQGKKMKIIVIYTKAPPSIVEDRLNELKSIFYKEHVVFVWGEQKDLATLTTKP
ncbi:DUF6572 domain-containing protein [Undibacterium sp. Ren11W]|uniref:DUF6572 domain-containing protein n=1 Tax=Undibacterium sp. Ren11W TaxID=3413045 RepID=UPI003BF30BB1